MKRQRSSGEIPSSVHAAVAQKFSLDGRVTLKMQNGSWQSKGYFPSVDGISRRYRCNRKALAAVRQTWKAKRSRDNAYCCGVLRARTIFQSILLAGTLEKRVLHCYSCLGQFPLLFLISGCPPAQSSFTSAFDQLEILLDRPGLEYIAACSSTSETDF